MLPHPSSLSRTGKKEKETPVLLETYAAMFYAIPILVINEEIIDTKF
jgi:hypothetical protein